MRQEDLIRTRIDRNMIQDDLDAISLQISVDKKTYDTGSRIRGNISFSVPQAAAGCNDFSGIHLSLEGEETIESHSLMWGTSWQSEQAKSNIITIDKEVVHFLSPLVAGKYEYPFCWKLPEESLPGSMRCVSHNEYGDFTNRSKCGIKYYLKAYLSTSSSKSEWTVLSCDRRIHIKASGPRTNHHRKNHGTVVEPKEFKINSRLRRKGSIELGLDTDATAVSHGSTLEVGITGRNLSSVPVEKLLVQLIETVHWRGGKSCHDRECTRIVSATTVPAYDLPCAWQQKRKDKTIKRRRESGILTADESVETDRVVTHLRLKSDARDSYKGQMIQVNHSLQITALTKCKRVTNPQISASIEVQRGQQSEEASTPAIMAQAQLLFPPNDGTISNENQVEYYNIVQPGIEIPEAIAVNTNIDDPFFQAVEQNQNATEPILVSALVKLIDVETILG